MKPAAKLLLCALALASVAAGLSADAGYVRAGEAKSDAAAERARQNLQIDEQKLLEEKKDAARAAAAQAKRKQQLKREEEQRKSEQENLDRRRQREQRVQELIEK